MAFASSLDQIGPMARDAMDCAAALELISGPDGRDSTSLMKKPFRFAGEAADIKGLRIGVPENYFEMGIADEVKTAVLRAAKVMESLGAEVSEFELPMIEYAAPAYYVIACAEASSNLSRYDGVKYGYRSKDAADMTEMFYKSRSEGLGTEVKRRVMIGSFVLSSGYFDAYYKKALQVRGLIKKSFDEAFQRYDMVLSPVSPTVAYHIGRKTSDPVAMYMSDIYTVSVNLAGLPGVALPCGFDGDNMPIGMQFIGRAFSDDALIGAAAAYQKVTDYHRQRPSAFEKDSSLHVAARTGGSVPRGKGGGD
jgi:aspartyl-tRNA(Asn)/glutamyl-tRNA(Gln) amidotransferase subunit A